VGTDLSLLGLPEIRTRFLHADEPVTPALLRRLERDPREGARKLSAQLRRRYERERDERLRLDALLNFERVLWRAGLRRVAGVDEAGTGPLAGPVVAAAVVFPPGTAIEGIDDSKRLDPERRTELARVIHARAAGTGIGLASVEEIDRLNVYQASLLAMRRAVLALPEPPEHVLVDARTIPELACPQNAFSKGDGIDFSIAAASILAKTHRDRLMDELDVIHPGYGFARHKGYSTPEHQRAVRRLGPSPVHRRSFTFLRELCGGYSERFYTLQDRLERAGSRGALAACEQALEEHAAALDPVEHRKLRLVLRRRWRTLG
jgi:ribonuclease HII